MLFKRDVEREALIFPASLTPAQRRVVHTLAHNMGLGHLSRGNGDQRQVHVVRPDASNVSPPLQQGPIMGDSARRVLNRAATTDFSEARVADTSGYALLRGQHSTGFLGVPDSPGGFANQQNLRAAKSFADLRSYTPSPAQSTASFPVGLQSNIARFQDAGLGSTAVNPTINATSSGSLSQYSNENMLVNGLSNMTIGTSIGTGGSPRRVRSVFSWDDNQGPPTAPIGSNRNFSMNNFDETSRDRNQIIPSRQPRGPAVERGQGFARRQNGHQTRGSDEIKQQNSNIAIPVE
jgi:hypothetical protein